MAASLARARAVRVLSSIIHGHSSSVAAVQHHTICPRWSVNVCPVAFIHTGPVSASSHSSATAVEKIPEHIQKPLWDDNKLEPSGP